tara:strand:+ start:729 stop:1052 length:324 start_codon:yes stop_codon:yes gene_type:complete
MAVVRRAQSGASIRKKAEVTQSVRSTRQPSRLEEMSDTAFGTLDESKDGLIVSFDRETKNFVLVTADTLLDRSTEDNNLSDTFITQLEQEINLADVSVDNIDGGTFT